MISRTAELSVYRSGKYEAASPFKPQAIIVRPRADATHNTLLLYIRTPPLNFPLNNTRQRRTVNTTRIRYNQLMVQQNTRFDFGTGKKPESDFILLENIIEDRGSKYSVSYGRVESRQEIKDFLTRLKKKTKSTLRPPTTPGRLAYHMKVPFMKPKLTMVRLEPAW